MPEMAAANSAKKPRRKSLWDPLDKSPEPLRKSAKKAPLDTSQKSQKKSPVQSSQKSQKKLPLKGRRKSHWDTLDKSPVEIPQKLSKKAQLESSKKSQKKIPLKGRRKSLWDSLDKSPEELPRKTGRKTLLSSLKKTPKKTLLASLPKSRKNSPQRLAENVPQRAPVSKPVARATPKTPSASPMATRPNNLLQQRPNNGFDAMSLLMEIQMKRESLLVQKKVTRPTEFVKRLTNHSPNAEQIPSAIKFRRSYGVKNTTDQTNGNSNGATKQYSMSLGNFNSSFTSNGGTPNKYIVNASFASANGVDAIPGPSRDEFYNYLRIDTKPPMEKSPEPPVKPEDPSNNQRRSLRVFMQQRQMESITRSQEKITKDDEKVGKKSAKSPCKSVRNLPITQPLFSDSRTAALANRRRSEGYILSQRPKESDDLLDDDESSPKTHILFKRSYHRSTYTLSGNEPSQEIAKPAPIPLSQNNNVEESKMDVNRIEAIAVDDQRIEDIEPEATSSNTIENKTIATNTFSKRRILITSPLMLSEIMRKYGKCVRRGATKQFAYHPRIFRRLQRKPTVRSDFQMDAIVQPPVRSVAQNDLNRANQMSMDLVRPVTSRTIDTQTDMPPPIIPFSPTSITHSTASSDSAVVINRAAPELIPEPATAPAPTIPRVTMTASQSLQWYQENSIGVDRSKCSNPLQVKHGRVRAILTQSIAANQNECIVVVQDSMVSYWFSPAKMVGVFGVERTWLPVAQRERCVYMGEFRGFCSFYENIFPFFSIFRDVGDFS